MAAPAVFADFPVKAAPASILVERWANAMAAKGMLWQTGALCYPAADVAMLATVVAEFSR